MLELRVYKGERHRQTIPISHRAYVLGRSINSDIVLPDHRVSRKHCSIYFDPDSGEFRIVDLNSKLGTWINGKRVERPHPLHVGDTISFSARSEFVVRFARQTSEPLPAESPEDSEKRGKMHVTSTINIRKVVRDSEHQIVRSRSIGGADKQAAAPKTAEAAQAAIAGEPMDASGAALLAGRDIPRHFYDLSCRLALTSHYQQVYETLAEHVFGTTSANRLMILRMRPKSTQREDEDLSNTAFRRLYTIDFCEFSSTSAEAAKSAGTRFSRSVVRQSVEDQKALLFTHAGSKTDSQVSIQASSSICAPIPGRNEVLGVLYLDVFQGGNRDFNSADLELAGMYAYLFGLYVERQKSIEDRRESERLASAGLAVFGAAHYLKNVLTGIQGSRSVIEILLKSGDLERLGETWGVMTRSLDAVNSTIKRMLQYARSAHLEKEPIDPAALMNEAAAGYLDFAREKGIELVVETKGAAFPIEADPECLEDVLRNLISNALDAFKYDNRSDREPARIVARTLYLNGANEVIWEVEDNGPGIPEDAQPRIFELFFTTKGAGGSGLGLALCQKYMVAHEGRLEFVTSNRGTTFSAALPASAKRSIDYATFEP